MNKVTTIGKIIIAGAGPGDPDLITVKALRYLQQADVVITDRLVSSELLTFVKPGAQIIFAGKQGGNAESTSQHEINALLVDHALKNKLVLRLKGGDVSIFSNLLDELETIVAHQIPYEIIPGITAASGAAAYAGIPLTARGHATAVRFLTSYRTDIIDDSVWKELAQTNDTLVFYMSSANLDSVVANLLDHGIAADKYLAVIEQATTPQQRVRIFNLYEYEVNSKEIKPVSPSIIIIGKVAGLHLQFGWMHSKGSIEYFVPVKKSANSSSLLIPRYAC
jgi:uroporphyrin-III C-methyltransferase